MSCICVLHFAIQIQSNLSTTKGTEPKWSQWAGGLISELTMDAVWSIRVLKREREVLINRGLIILGGLTVALQTRMVSITLPLCYLI